MSDQIIKILDDLGDRFGMAIDWSSKTVTPYLKDLMARFINYEIGVTIINIIICLMILITGVILICKLHKNKEFGVVDDGCGEDAFARFSCYVCLLVVLIGVTNGIVSYSKHIIACITIPEKVVCDYIIDQTQEQENNE